MDSTIKQLMEWLMQKAAAAVAAATAAEGRIRQTPDPLSVLQLWQTTNNDPLKLVHGALDTF
jgi:hypothetical protein